jgi:hypothetical protein
MAQKASAGKFDRAQGVELAGSHEELKSTEVDRERASAELRNAEEKLSRAERRRDSLKAELIREQEKQREADKKLRLSQTELERESCEGGDQRAAESVDCARARALSAKNNVTRSEVAVSSAQDLVEALGELVTAFTRGLARVVANSSGSCVRCITFHTRVSLAA